MTPPNNISVQVYNAEGKATGQRELNPAIFGVALKPQLVHEAVRIQQANARQPLAHTKTRAEVRGGGIKPWRQKGTGRARHGSIRSPIWRHGGVTFGPRNVRNYHLAMNIKAKRKALFMTLTDKVSQKRFILVETLTADGKTKSMSQLLKKLPIGKSVLLVLAGKNDSAVRATRNLPRVASIRADSLNVYDVMKRDTIVAPVDAVSVIEKTYLKA